MGRTMPILTSPPFQAQTQPKFPSSNRAYSSKPLVGAAMASGDIDLKCSQCGADFVFTASEHEFFNAKGYTNLPKRCRKCRADLNSRRARVDTTVTCSDCGLLTTVPFKPTQGKPVFCRGCFLKLRLPS